MNLAYLEIDYHRSAYDAMPRHVRQEFQERLMLSWLYHESALEGIVLTREDLWRALDHKPCRNYCDDRRDQLLRRMKASMTQLLSEAGSREALSLEWIKAQHGALCDEGSDAAGRYRKRDTSPGVYNLDVVAANSISYYFRKFIELYEAELTDSHPVRAAALAHWEFMKVFPFDELTGLVGRLMLNAILLRNDYPPAVFHASNRHKYFAALSGHRGDMIPVVVEAVSSTISAASAFSHELHATNTSRLAL